MSAPVLLLPLVLLAPDPCELRPSEAWPTARFPASSSAEICIRGKVVVFWRIVESNARESSVHASSPRKEKGIRQQARFGQNQDF